MRPPLWVGSFHAAGCDRGDVARKTITLQRENGEVLCERCLLADSFWRRFRGLLGRKELPQGEGLLIRPSGSVHTLFMRFPIDVVFLDREDRVVKVVPSLRPWRLAAARGARRTVELAAGACSHVGLTPGERLVWSAS
jgi:uncharacterized membrane protein (UPF0127 family)